MLRKLLIAVTMLATLPLAATPGQAAGTGMQYVVVDDGTEIAVQVFLPSNYVAGNTYPALVEIEGYGGAGSPKDTTFVNKADYVVVAISVRGTGCSAGQLELFSQRSAMDGAWIIDNWIPNQTWSNGDVGIYGHSYGGLTGFLVAAQSPTHLRATAVSGLIDDFYRGVLYPGGIPNYGFPLLWVAGGRSVDEHEGNASYMMSDHRCAANYADHRGSSLLPTPASLADTYGSPFATEDSWAIQNALLTHIGGITAPIQLDQRYQDEQSGPRGGPVLWENIPAGTPKRITLSTGRHTPIDPTVDRRDWLDCYLRFGGSPTATTSSGKSCAVVMDPSKKALLYFESMGYNRLAPYVAADWPLPETDWRRLYLRSDLTLSETRAGGDGGVSYVSTGNSRHLTLDGGTPYNVNTGAPLAPYGFTTGPPDTARYTHTFTEDTALAGPINLSLYASISSPNTDFWAEILDRDTVTGATTFVQRGLLRASAAAEFDASKSQYTPGGDLYRPYYGYKTITPIVPGEVNKYEIEVFPFGHVWRAGHELVLQLHAPPANDPISAYAYETTTPAVVTIVQDAAHPTSILLPFMSTLPPYRETQPACGWVFGEVCITPALG